MGNKAALLEGAKRCLATRGWARTTVRDIGREAGVSHAAIGYHFGSREHLLLSALSEATEELGEVIAADVDTEDQVALLEALLKSFHTHRSLWVAQVEAISQAQHVPALRKRLAEAQADSQAAYGAVPLALLLGLMIQSLIDEDSTPSIEDVRRQILDFAEQLRPKG